MKRLKQDSPVNKQLKFFGKLGFHSSYSKVKPRVRVKAKISKAVNGDNYCSPSFEGASALQARAQQLQAKQQTNEMRLQMQSLLATQQLGSQLSGRGAGIQNQLGNMYGQAGQAQQSFFNGSLLQQQLSQGLISRIYG